MRVGGTAAWRAVFAMAAATLAAGLVGGLWGTPTVRAAAHDLVAPASSAPASRVTLPAAGPSASPAPTGPAADGAQAADAAIASVAAGRPAGSVSVAALDTTTRTRVGWNADSAMTVASVFKLSLLEGYLLENQDRGQSPGVGAQDALNAMIDNSDNDAADQVYALLGGRAGVTSTLARLGMTATMLGPNDQWGLSSTTATDQLVALTDLVSPQSPLSSSSRAYALGLLSDVEADQRWGVGAATDTGSDFANKNGWLNVDDDGGRWAVNSVGVIQVGGHQVLLAVLTQHDVDLADGTELVESISRSVATALQPQRR